MTSLSALWRLLPAMLLCVASLGAALTASGPDDGLRAVVFPPWWSASHVMTAAAAAGRVVAFGAVSFVVVVAPEPGASAIPGALLWFPARRAEACGLTSAS